MINKKRLFTLSMATSLVLPTIVSIPVLADTTTTDTTTSTDTTTDLTLDTITTNTYVLDGSTAPLNYILTEDITRGLTKAITVKGTVTIDLNQKTISSGVKHVFEIERDAVVTIKNGTITSLYYNTADPEEAGSIIWVQGKATVDLDEVNLTAASDAGFTWGLCVYKNSEKDASGSKVTIKNSKIQTAGGLTVNGNMVEIDGEGKPTTTVDLDNVTITANDNSRKLVESRIGIYQAGISTINVKNSKITSDSSGIETRAGTLNVENSTVAGGNGDLELRAHSYGTTTNQTGISVAQHVSGKPIEVNVKNSSISGSAALAIADPQGNQDTNTDVDSDGYDENIKINVTDKSTLSGSKYDVLYTEDTIQFKLDGVTVDEKKIAKLEPKTELDTGSDEYVALVPAQSGSGQKPYKAENITTPVYSSPSGGGNKKPSKPKPEEPAEEPMTPVGTPTSMYRLYNKLTGEHLYTIDKNERDNLLTSDTWKDEGEGWIAPSESAYPVYRLLNPNNGDHHYTTDKNEFDTLPSLGWVAEGVAFFSADKDNAENVLLHRLYNPNAKGAGSHHYTADTNERDTLVAQGWTYEGLAWAGLPANK